jgi:hypothetical protein
MYMIQPRHRMFCSALMGGGNLFATDKSKLPGDRRSDDVMNKRIVSRGSRTSSDSLTISPEDFTVRIYRNDSQLLRFSPRC